MQELTCKTELAAYVSRMAAKLPKGRAVLNTSRKKQTVQHVFRVKTFKDGITILVNRIKNYSKADEMLIINMTMISYQFPIHGNSSIWSDCINCLLAKF